MSKYIIDITLDNIKKVVAMGVTKGGAIWTDTTDIENLEELNSDYINEHYGELQDTAYQRGLEDAWECGKKLAWTAKYGGYGERLSDVFGRDDTFDFYDYTPNEAIAKLKAYEEKQKADDDIKVGDEVNWLGDCFIVTRIFQPHNMKEQCDGIDDDGCVYHDVLVDDLEKTGRHFDIASILEEMRHD